jgi:hypothetical protein
MAVSFDATVLNLPILENAEITVSQGQFSGQRDNLFAGSMRRANNDQCAGVKGWNDIHVHNRPWIWKENIPREGM